MNTLRFKPTITLSFTLFLSLFLAITAQAQGDIIWVGEVTTTDVTTTSPSPYNFTQNGVNVTVSYAFSSPPPGRHDTSLLYFSTSTGTIGAEAGYFRFDMNATTENISEWIEATFAFSPGIEGLGITLLDIDYNNTGWRDVVRVIASDGVSNVAPTTVTLGGVGVEGPTANGNCSSLNSATTPCFRGIANFSATFSDANVTLTYSGSITQIKIRYYSSEMANLNDPNNQAIGLGDITWATMLPVELTSFTAQTDGPNVELLWKTASETNNAGFEVQHLDANSSNHWNTRAFVEGFGTTELAQSYRHRIEGLQPGTHRFRLKQIDYDGSFEYSDEVEVVVGLSESLLVEEVYPNPFNAEGIFRFGVARTQDVRVTLYDVLGREVDRLFEGRAMAGQMHQVSISSQRLPSGTYFVRVQGEHFSQAVKALVAK